VYIQKVWEIKKGRSQDKQIRRVYRGETGHPWKARKRGQGKTKEIKIKEEKGNTNVKKHYEGGAQVWERRQ